MGFLSYFLFADVPLSIDQSIGWLAEFFPKMKSAEDIFVNILAEYTMEGTHDPKDDDTNNQKIVRECLSALDEIIHHPGIILLIIIIIIIYYFNEALYDPLPLLPPIK